MLRSGSATRRASREALERPAPVALVTGAGKRLGREIALELARHGFDIVLNYHSSRAGAMSTAKAIRALGRQCLAIRADVTDRREVGAMVRSAAFRFRRIDLLVNNSAVFRRATLRSATEKEWDEALDTNLKGVFLVSQAVSARMLEQGGGSIVNIASLGGLQAWKEHLPYSVSKAGVVMLTRILARELAPTIRVNAIAPGTISFPGEEAPGIEHLPLTKIPLGTYGKPADVTDMVVFLATKAAYITGQVIAIDGGRSVSLS